MQYRVKWFVGEREVGSTPFSSLSTAKSHAMEHFPAKQMQSGVDRVEVRDEGIQRFRHADERVEYVQAIMP